jgi:hypothetical protein
VRCSVEGVGFNIIGYLIMMIILIIRPMQGMIECVFKIWILTQDATYIHV